MKSFFKVFIIVLPLALTRCAQSKTDLESEEHLIMKTDSEWAAAAMEGKDIEKIISYWSDDAVVLPPNQPAIKGKSALRQFVTESEKIPGFKISWKSEEVHFSPDKMMAYMYSENLTNLNDSTGKPITINGRGYTVWRKDTNGDWKCAVDIWNNSQ